MIRRLEHDAIGAQSPSTHVRRALPQASKLLGTTIADRFELSATLGTGGQAWVFLAHDRSVDQLVALKLLRPEVRSDDTALRRFKREREELARLRHRNVVAVIDHGVDVGVGPWFTMEHLRGETLAERIARHDLVPAREAVSLIADVLSPVAMLHAQGRAHRDLKPSNVFIAESDDERRPVLLDFGICFRPTRDSTHERITQDGEAVGTPGYLAPEALVSTPTRLPLLDVWSAAVMLIEIVTGARVVPVGEGLIPVFRSADEWEEHLDVFEALSDDALAKIVARALSVDLDERPADASAMRAELCAWLEAQVTVAAR